MREAVNRVAEHMRREIELDGVLPRPDTLDDETLTREVMRLVTGYLRPRPPQ